ncbi:glycosyltransferase [Natronogracilivirga saccharolytica]|uniref:Glycosyltransferase n=1 Tax=Natronogracilivirga saccharolytica TaxID=2812953 RepID=A0A8J7UUV6_9BACT|nr:glycosyltransferase [Natronogracilivirga saccharolytica]MBP3194016.1 glycosyltransferase [Natronogracilivirga saccharolytica]
MNVIYVCGKSNFFTKGYSGSVVHAMGIVDGLLKNNCEVELITGPGSDKYMPKNNKLKLITIPAKKNNYISEIVWRKKLLLKIKERIQECDILMLRYGFLNPLLTIKTARICKENRVKSVLELNSFGADHYDIEIFKQWIKVVENIIIKRYDYVYVVSEVQKKRIKEDNINNVITIPNATHNVEIANKYENKATRFVYMGGINGYYDYDEIINAFNEIKKKNIELAIYGGGKYYSDIKKKVIENTNIYLMGKYDNKRITKLVNRSNDILLLPTKKGSLAEIGSPTKLFEYMILGVPILASNVGQTSNIIKHKVNGYIYEAGNNRDLINKMNYLLNNKTERQRVGLNAHNEALVKHNWKNRMGNMLKEIMNIKDSNIKYK